MSMRSLPDRPDLDQLRRQAKELRDSARGGDGGALDRISTYAPGLDPAVLATAQLVIAREYGCGSWAGLKTEVQARAAAATMSRDERVLEFLAASISGMTMRRAARLLAIDPGIAGHDFRTAVILGDADRVRRHLTRDPGLAIRPDTWSGWLPLHGVCMSRWHHIDGARTAGLTEVARLLLDAGGDPDAAIGRQGERGYCAPLYAAAGCADNPAITELLLHRGGHFDDHTVYLAAFHHGHECLRLLLDHGPLAADSTALAAPISTGDTEGARLLLDGGADPVHALPGDLFGERHPADPPLPPVYAAVQFECPAELVELLLDRGADPDATIPGGQAPYQLAVRHGRTDLAGLLAESGARREASPVDRLLDACLRADHRAAERLLHDNTDLMGRLTDADHAALVRAADHGNVEAVRLMLELGFPIDARGDVDGVTALHAAAGAGGAEVVRLLLARGADIDAGDTTWNSPPLHWATIGSGFRLGHCPTPDWVATVQAFIDAGASLDGAWIDGKPPSPEVAQLLTAHGVSEPDE
jgi:hypothetical protein